MKKLLLIISVLTLSLVALSGCIKKDDVVVDKPTTTIVENNTPKTTAHTPMNESMKMDEEHEMMPMAGELTAEEAKKYGQEGLTVEEKIALSKELAMKMPRNGMQHIRRMFPDIQLSQSITSEDPRNMMMMGPESWEYSVEGDITIVVCNEIDSPVHVFQGKNITQDDIKDAMEMMHDMMNGMEEEHMMMTEQGPGKYINYTENAILNTPGKKILFFHASWCPNCRAADKDLTAAVLPNEITVFKADYDSEDTLKQKYAITSQHTFVQIDDEGNMIKKWTGGASKEIIANI